MKIASVADIKAHFSAYLRDAVRGPVVVTRNGKSVGVLLAVGDEEELERLVLAYSPRLRTILEAARQRIRAGAGVPHQEFWQELEGGNEGKRQSGPRRKTA
jgi:prevent-host-death family protein